jgi:hypothetical protein
MLHIEWDKWDKHLEVGESDYNPKPVNIPLIKSEFDLKNDKYKEILLRLQIEQNERIVNGDSLLEEDKELCRYVNSVGQKWIWFTDDMNEFEKSISKASSREDKLLLIREEMNRLLKDD